MTKTGPPQARRALGAGAWASRSPAPGRRHLPRRLEPRPTALQARSWQAQVRLCTRDRPLMATGHHAQQVVGAMARAWSACLGALAPQVTVPPQERVSLPHKRSRVPTGLGRGAAPVWWNPRQRAAADRDARPSHEAGTRRTQVRWEPTHGEQRDQPSCLPGSGSADGRSETGGKPWKQIGSSLLTSEVISTLGLSRA
jgi:hypothetical protein